MRALKLVLTGMEVQLSSTKPEENSHLPIFNLMKVNIVIYEMMKPQFK